MGVRVVHSLVQATRNVIMIRFGLFVLSSVVLSSFAIRAALAVF